MGRKRKNGFINIYWYLLVYLILLGSSPHFKVALYTLCFLCGAENNCLHIAGYDVNIKCYKYNTHKGDKIATSTIL